MDKLSLKRIEGVYYIQFDNELIQIEEWEAALIMQDHQAVFDIVVDHRRKYNFNTAEDRPDSLI
ncbi:MAG: hypothetical protein K6F92_07030 [Lachnospiraceae bacterium]|nr:hypothetical protein [Lachnospiraceae bacterium]